MDTILLGEFLYNAIRSPLFWVALIFWIIVLIAWEKKRKPVFERLWNLWRKPHIFKDDPEPENVRFYLRKFFEDAARAIKDTLKEPFTKLLDGLSRWLNNEILPMVYDKEHRFRLPASLFFLTLFVLFGLADYIITVNTLAILDLYTRPLTGLVTFYEYAILAGSIGTVLVGVLIFLELLEKKSVFTYVSDKNDSWRGVFRGFSLLISLLGFLSIIIWAYGRMVALGYVSETAFGNNLVQWFLHGAVPFNITLAMAIIFQYAFKGTIVIFWMLCWFLAAIIWCLNWIARIIGVLFPFTFDISYRSVYTIIEIAIWVIATPILFILKPFEWIGRLLFPQRPREPDEPA